MNPDPASNASSGPSHKQRKGRGAIAAQACDTCRSRKQKCDEQRPKCGLCSRMKSECRYRKPQPIKKDKTLVEIVDHLKSLEGKVDQISTLGSAGGFGPPPRSPASRPTFNPDIDKQSAYSANLMRQSQQSSPSGIGRNQPYRHASAAHKMLTWPAVQQVLLQTMSLDIEDLKSLELEGSAFIVRLQKGSPNLPLDEALQDRPFVGMQTPATRAAGGARTTFPGLTRDTMLRLTSSYFDTFNLIYPFMNRQNFLSDTLGKVHSEGFNGDNESVIALLIFALGELSIEGVSGSAVESHDGRPSGVRGGTISRPPGLAFFNEARKRIGFVLTECDLENVQIFSLAALYYGSCSRHVDSWRLTVSASRACEVLVTCNRIEWDTLRGDLIKRAYWHCVIMETGLHLELDLPLTGIISLEDRVGIPTFIDPFCEADHRCNQSSHFEALYASQLALRRLCMDSHNTINDSMSNSATPRDSEGFTGPTANSLKQLALQLSQWRAMLPQQLQWAESDPTSFPKPQSASPGGYNQPLDLGISPIASHSGMPMFTVDLDAESVQYRYAYDIQVALLRTRHHYAKYLIYRPFVHKALHHPEHMTSEDAEGAAECLRSCLKWPLAFSPSSRRKRMIPYLSCWSENFLGILLIFYISRHNSMLRDIRTNLCGPRFEADVEQSSAVMIDWIRDLKTSDPIASWCWKILKGIYQLDHGQTNDE